MTDPTAAITVEEFLATAAPRTETVRVCARGDLVDRHNEILDELDQLVPKAGGSLAEGPDTETIDRLLDEAATVEDDMDRFTMPVKLQGIGARAWADLLRAHPPEKQHGRVMHHPHTFPPAAVAACSVAPKLTLEQATEMFEGKLHSAEWIKLWNTTVALNERETPHPKLGALTDLARAKRPSADSPQPTGSLADRSSAGADEQSQSTTTTTTDA